MPSSCREASKASSCEKQGAGKQASSSRPNKSGLLWPPAPSQSLPPVPLKSMRREQARFSLLNLSWALHETRTCLQAQKIRAVHHAITLNE